MRNTGEQVEYLPLLRKKCDSQRLSECWQNNSKGKQRIWLKIKFSSNVDIRTRNRWLHTGDILEPSITTAYAVLYYGGKSYYVGKWPIGGSHICSFKLTSEICQLPVLALIHSVEWHQAEGKSIKISSSFTVFCQTSLVISQQRVTVYDNANAHSALRTELNSLSVSVSIFTNDVNNQYIAEVPERPSCCLLFVEAALTKLWFFVSLLPFHMYCTCHGE